MYKTIFCIYLLIINLTGLMMFYSDKKRARQRRYRIPEARLFLTALAGGAAGCLLGMYLFRHKTRHARVVIGMPLILIFWILSVICFFHPDFSNSAGRFLHTFFDNL